MMSKSKNNQYDSKHFINLTKKRFKKKFGKAVKQSDINKVWKNWVDNYIIENVIEGSKVKIDKHSSIQLLGYPVLEDSKFKSLIMKGKMMNRGGIIVDSKRNIARKEFKYKLVYENKLSKDKKIYFKAHPNFSKKVHEALINTNNYYKIVLK